MLQTVYPEHPWEEEKFSRALQTTTTEGQVQEGAQPNSVEWRKQ
jgi:hypothetical protein